MEAEKGQPELEDIAAWQETLTSRVEELRTEISSKQEDLARAEERLSLVTKLLSLESRAHGLRSGSSDQEPGPLALHPPAPSTRPTNYGLEDAVEEILRTAGEPLHISVIRETLLAQGFPIPGRGDEANIIVRLRRIQDRFTRTARGTYGLAEWGLPQLTSKSRRRHRAGSR